MKYNELPPELRKNYGVRVYMTADHKLLISRIAAVRNESMSATCQFILSLYLDDEDVIADLEAAELAIKRKRQKEVWFNK